MKGECITVVGRDDAVVRDELRCNLGALVRLLGPALLASVLLGCTPSDPCAEVPVHDGSCADLRFSGRFYDEWRPVELPEVTQELGDAPFPACNDSEPCNGPDLHGHAATDVWLLGGVDPLLALIGYRQGTETPVIFVRKGIDPAEVPGLDAYAD